MGADPEPERQRAAELIAAGERLRVDAAAVQALAALADAGVAALLLKGSTVATWLYADPEERLYVDCDLLVDPAAAERAEVVLERLDYRRAFDERQMPAWWREHAVEWVRGDGVTVDLHRSLPGVGAAPAAAWGLLWAEAVSVDLLGQPVPALSLRARALHVVLHAAHHGIDGQRALSDLERALERVDDASWRAVAQLAHALGAAEGFAAGLALTAPGADLAARLGLPPAAAVRTRLLATSPPPLALGFAQLADTRGLGARATIVARKLVPPAEFIRRWDPRATAGRRALLAAYVRRPVWLLARAPAGLRAWQRARRG